MSNIPYSINFQNNSTKSGSVCIYQTNPKLGPDVMSLAWFAKNTHPSTRETFVWHLKYGFIWGESEELTPGIIVKSSQDWPADLTKNNKITFLKDKNAYTFSNLTKGDKSGILQIDEDDSLPANCCTVGISMSGSAVFVKQAQPNMKLFFEPHPEYWITFGDYKTGQILDITEISNKQKLEFKHDVYSISAILNADNTWTVK